MYPDEFHVDINYQPNVNDINFWKNYQIVHFHRNIGQDYDSCPKLIKMLQSMGFKTFDKWWDESYDEETEFSKRLEKIVNVLEEISSWSLDECFRITQEMEEVLVHNFNHMLSDDDIFNLFKLLTSNTNTDINNQITITNKKLI